MYFLDKYLFIFHLPSRLSRESHHYLKIYYISQLYSTFLERFQWYRAILQEQQCLLTVTSRTHPSPSTTTPQPHHHLYQVSNPDDCRWCTKCIHYGLTIYPQQTTKPRMISTKYTAVFTLPFSSPCPSSSSLLKQPSVAVAPAVYNWKIRSILMEDTGNVLR